MSHRFVNLPQVSSAFSEDISAPLQKSFAGIYEVTNRYQSIAQNLEKAFLPSAIALQSWVEKNKKIYRGFGKLARQLSKDYQLAEDKALKVLAKYKWFITPGMPASLIYDVVKLGRKRNRQDKQINAIFAEYYSANNWEQIEQLVDSWVGMSIRPTRLRILKNVAKSLRTMPRSVNPAYSQEFGRVFSFNSAPVRTKFGTSSQCLN